MIARMPYPFRHCLLSFGGPLFAVEQWSMGLRFTPPHPIGDQAAMQATCNAMHAAVQAWWPSGMVSAAAQHAYTKFNEIRADGKYNQGYTVRTDDATPLPGTGAARVPPQVALVVTLGTGVSRGLASRGRIFIPSPMAAMNTATGTLDTAMAVTHAGLAKTLIDNLNAVAPGARVIIASDVREGAQQNVTTVEVGRVLDTMRSRRAQLGEARSSAALAAGP